MCIGINSINAFWMIYNTEINFKCGIVLIEYPMQSTEFHKSNMIFVNCLIIINKLFTINISHK